MLVVCYKRLPCLPRRSAHNSRVSPSLRRAARLARSFGSRSIRHLVVIQSLRSLVRWGASRCISSAPSHACGERLEEFLSVPLTALVHESSWSISRVRPTPSEHTWHCHGRGRQVRQVAAARSQWLPASRALSTKRLSRGSIARTRGRKKSGGEPISLHRSGSHHSHDLDRRGSRVDLDQDELSMEP